MNHREEQIRTQMNKLCISPFVKAVKLFSFRNPVQV